MGTILVNQNGRMRSIKVQNKDKNVKEEQNDDLMLECYRDKIKQITTEINQLEAKKEQLEKLIDKIVG